MATIAAALLLAGVLDAGADTSGDPVTWPPAASPFPPDPALENRIDDVLARLSLHEKVGQIIQADIRWATPDDVREYRLGAILNGGGAFPHDDKNARVEDWLAMADAYYRASMDTSTGKAAVPILWGIDAVHGHGGVRGATIFPHNVGLGATRNPTLVRAIAAATAREVAVTGLDWTFAPTLAVAADRRWGRGFESFSQDPMLVATLGREAVLGLQGDPADGTAFGPDRILATAKHFIGDGGTERGRDQGVTWLTEADLAAIHGLPYAAAINAGVQTVMASYNSWNNEKLHGQRYLLTDVLRGRLGFDGLVVGDWNGHEQIPGCSRVRCAEAIVAGVDLIMVPQMWRDFHRNTVQQVIDGALPQARLDEAVRRILRVKMRVGAFDRGAPSERPWAGRGEWLGHPDHRALARQAVRESLVLLKNDGGVLPVAPSSRILVAGAAATTIVAQTGGWSMSWQGADTDNADFPGATSIYNAIAAAADAAGGHADFSADGSFRERPDVALVVFAEPPYAEMQGDLDHLAFRAEHPDGHALLTRLRTAGVPTVAVFLTGRPRWVNPELNASDAFVVAWLPGSEAGGIADVLLRARDGSIAHDVRGRLPFAWPAHPEPEAGMTLFEVGDGLSYGSDRRLGVLPEEPAVEERALGPAVPLFRRQRPSPPFQMFAGDGADWSVSVFDAGLAAFGGQPMQVAAVDTNRRGSEADEAGRRVVWPGGGATGHLRFATLVPVDLSRLLDGSGTLAVDVKVVAPPAGSVMVGACHQGYCAHPFDLGQQLREAPPGEVLRVRVDLRCVIDNAVIVREADTPLSVYSDQAMTLEIVRASIERSPNVDAPGAPAVCSPAAP